MSISWLRGPADGPAPPRIVQAAALYHERAGGARGASCAAVSAAALAEVLSARGSIDGGTASVSDGFSCGWLGLASSCNACGCFVADLRAAAALAAAAAAAASDGVVQPQRLLLSPLAVLLGARTADDGSSAGAGERFEASLAAPRADAVDSDPIATPSIVEQLRASGAARREEALAECASLAAAASQCPYVLRVYGILAVGEDEGVGLVLERTAGPLSAVVSRASTSQRLVLLAQAAFAVAGLHAGGLVHGRLRAACFQIASDGEVRVAGAGLHRTRAAIERAAGSGGGGGGGGNGAGHSGGGVGTWWTAPELFAVRVAVLSVAADAFAFGVACWEILAGGAAPTGPHDATSGRPAVGWRPDLDDMAADVPDAVCDVLRALWAEGPEARPGLAGAAEALLAGSGALVPERIAAAIRGRWQQFEAAQVAAAAAAAAVAAASAVAAAVAAAETAAAAAAVAAAAAAAAVTAAASHVLELR